MNRNTATNHVPPLNVVDGQSAFKLTMAHFTAPQLTNNGCHSANTMNNFSSSHLSTNCGSGSSPLENLPKKFVSSMRTLFDIMDDKRTGFVRLSDIEARWQDDGSKGLPHGVIDCLRRVTPVSGMLSFERFCAGLKICLLRNQTNDCPVNRRSSIDSINSGNSSNSSNNHKNHIIINTTTNTTVAPNNGVISVNNGDRNNNNNKSSSSNNSNNNNNNNNNSSSNSNSINQHHNNISMNSDENNNSNSHKSNRATRSTNSNGKGNTDVQKADEEDDYEDNRINGSNTNKSSDNIYTSNCNKSLNKVKKSSISESNKNGLGPTSMNGDAIKTVHLRSSLPVQRTLSLPKLSPSSDGDSFSDPYIMASLPSAYAPPKPPRTGLQTNGPTNLADTKDRYDKAEIRNALQNWQMNVLMNEWEAKDKRRAMALPNTRFITRGTADGSSNNTMAAQQSISQQTSLIQTVPQNSNMTQSNYPTNRSPTLLEFQKKSHRRREIRRHTLQNGIDYNMLKRIRHLEEEKDLLLDGLHAVEKAQEWYFKQIALIQEKMKRLSRGDGNSEQWSEANKERLDLQRARIMDVNRHLASLEESWEKGGFPMHMNLAVRNHYNNGGNSAGNVMAPFIDVQINQLKVQNRQLTEEVSQKSERITDLEMERKSLYRELLQYQQQHQQLQQQLIQKQGHILCGNEEVIF